MFQQHGGGAKMDRSFLKKAKRIVVKVGTSSVTYGTGKINLGGMDLLVREIADLSNEGREMILISSGAVGAGVGKLNLSEPPRTLPEKQALAAVGQGRLMHMYEKIFSEYGKTVAQILLTRDVFAHRLRYLNSRNTLESLLRFGVIPIINENDTVAVEEIRFGDNDTLSAMVACIAEANLAIILSDIDGLYDADPRIHANARIIPEVREITPKMLENSRSKGSALSSGGMFTKLAAANMTMKAGIPMVIARGDAGNPIRRVVAGEDIGTVFLPGSSRTHSRKHWIAFGRTLSGLIVVDHGAAEAILSRGKSLLPSGAVKVEGEFGRGSVVSVRTLEGAEIARGMMNYGSTDTIRILGLHTDEIEAVLGHKDYDELIHRNNMAIM